MEYVDLETFKSTAERAWNHIINGAGPTFRITHKRHIAMANDNTHTSQDPYPVSCPFCAIAATYPSLASPLTSHQSQDTKGRDLAIRLKSYVPEHTDHEKLEPNSHIVLQAPETMAFLDIMPMTAGHLLVTSRKHFVKVEDLPGTEAQDIGISFFFFFPLLWIPDHVFLHSI